MMIRKKSHLPLILLSATSFLIQSAAASASCMDDYFVENIALPEKAMKRLGRASTAGVGVSAAVGLASASMGPGAVIMLPTMASIVFGPSFIQNSGKVRALRIVSYAEGKDQEYFQQAVDQSNFSSDDRTNFSIFLNEGYFTADKNREEFENLHAKVSKAYERSTGQALDREYLKQVIVEGNAEKAFCSDAASFKRNKIVNYVETRLALDLSEIEDEGETK